MMQRAAAATAGEVATRYPEALRRGAFVLAGPGNNGGDGWAIARALHAAGIDVSVLESMGAGTPDCAAERDLALRVVKRESTYTGQGVVIDALLGTGSEGPIRPAMSGAREQIDLARRRDAIVVAVDLPSGLDATTGQPNGAARADLTITFGTVKRGQLIARGLCGDLVVVEIGLMADARETAPVLVTASWVRSMVPQIGAEAHKGTRKKMTILGGAPGMAGAVILSARAALRSGIGMVKACVHPLCADAVHAAVPEALVQPWPAIDDVMTDDWADVLVIGPGLGRLPDTRKAIESAAKRFPCAMVIDADGLNAFERDLDGLRRVVGDGNRSVIITPHVVEMGRLTGDDSEVVLDRRFEIGNEVREKTGAVVLLKGVPTVVGNLVVAAGTPALATAGSGDVLSGIAGTLLAQMKETPDHAAASAAWIHGRAAELAGAHTRGTTLDDVLDVLPNAWRVPHEMPRYPVIAELPAVAER